MKKIIEIKNLSFEYREGIRTINNISFDIFEGEYVAILGHNGSGKSTIAKLIIGLLEKLKGTIIVNGVELTLENLYKVRDNIGIVFQNPDNQFIGATVRDDIAFGLENNCVPQNQMDEIINNYASKVDMQDFLDHEPIKLSGGQKQRVAIAGILAMNPKIIILDEATSMLDPIGKREINNLVRKLNKEKTMTIISITHDIEEAKNADRIIVMHNSKVMAIGKPQEILSDETILIKYELDIPLALKVANSVRKLKIETSRTLDMEELVKELCQLHSKK